MKDVFKSTALILGILTILMLGLVYGLNNYLVSTGYYFHLFLLILFENALGKTVIAGWIALIVGMAGFSIYNWYKKR